MTQIQWKIIESFFHEALALPEEGRTWFLESIRRCDTSLYQGLCSLLAHNSPDRPLLNLEDLIRMVSMRVFDAGDQVGPYRILRSLGKGGMGEVYLAQDTLLERKVALKTLQLDFRNDAAGVDLLSDEAKAASGLNHPNILTVYECKEYEGLTCIICEYVDGHSLRELIGTPLSLEKILDYSRQIGDALQAAHAAGIVHCDIKPENIMVRHDGYIKVVDFGIAKLVKAKLDSGGSLHEKLSSGNLDGISGPLAGTLNYMSPEQVRGQDVDQRTDIWSWGVTLYEMLNGRRPFDASSKTEILINIIDKEPGPPCNIRPLNQLVAKALAKKPEERFQSMAEALEALGELDRLQATTSTFGFGVRSWAAKIRSRLVSHWRFVAIVIVLAAISIGVPPPPPPLPPPLVHLAEVSVLPCRQVIHGAISSDGKYYACVQEIEGRQSLWVGQVGTIGNTERIPADKNQYLGVTFSPVVPFIYFVVTPDTQQPGTLLRIPVLGSAGSEVVANGIDSPISFSPDGSRFAFVRYDRAADETSIIVRSTDENRETKLSTRKMPEGFWLCTLWSLDGKFVIGGVFNHAQQGMETTRLISIRLEDLHEEMTPSQDWSWMGWLRWIQGGRSLAVTARRVLENGPQLMQVSWPEGGKAIRITNESQQTYRDLESDAGLNRVSTVRTDRDASIWISNPNDLNQTPEPLAQGVYFGLTWLLSDGIISQTDMGGHPDLWLIDSHHIHHQLTHDTFTEENPVATPDGLYLVYVSNQGGTLHLWRSHLDGTDPIRLTSGPYNDRYPAITPDSKWVFFTSSRAGHDAVWKVPIQGGNPEPVTTAGRALRPSISPDGKLMVCQYSSSSNGPLVYSILTIKGRYLRSFPGISLGTPVRWTPDGKGLMYVVEHNGVSNVWAKSFQGGEIRKLTPYTSGRIFAFALSPDGKSLAVIRGGDTSYLVLMRITDDAHLRGEDHETGKFEAHNHPGVPATKQHP
jgi:serine/threonine protein kinase/Tol biopolymer transport system component